MVLIKKRCLLNRKGYFFLIDSIIALGVLGIGVFLIFTLYTNVPPKEEPAILSEDIMGFFADNKIKDINNPYAGLGGELWQQGKITNAENSLLQQVAEFYANNEIDIAELFIEKLTMNTLPPEYQFEFWLHDLKDPNNPNDDVKVLLYPAVEQTASKNAAKALIPSKKIAYGINQGTGEMFGPYTAEVLVWQ